MPDQVHAMIVVADGGASPAIPAAGPVARKTDIRSVALIWAQTNRTNDRAD
jgi:hypothetical protein